MKLVLVRHGQTIQNANRTIQGQKYGTLSKLGRKQVKQVAKELADEHFDVIYSSDLERCVDTMEAIRAFHKDTPVFLRTEIREFTFGVFEGQSSRNILARLGVVTGVTLPKRVLGVESLKNVRERVIPFINHIYEKHKDETVLVVTHGGPIKIIKATIDGIPWRKYRTIQTPNCGVWRFNINKSL